MRQAERKTRREAYIRRKEVKMSKEERGVCVSYHVEELKPQWRHSLCPLPICYICLMLEEEGEMKGKEGRLGRHDREHLLLYAPLRLPLLLSHHMENDLLVSIWWRERLL